MWGKPGGSCSLSVVFPYFYSLICHLAPESRNPQPRRFLRGREYCEPQEDATSALMQPWSGSGSRCCQSSSPLATTSVSPVSVHRAVWPRSFCEVGPSEPAQHSLPALPPQLCLILLPHSLGNCFILFEFPLLLSFFFPIMRIQYHQHEGLSQGFSTWALKSLWGK